jgi:hypothetical protein
MVKMKKKKMLVMVLAAGDIIFSVWQVTTGRGLVRVVQ